MQAGLAVFSTNAENFSMENALILGANEGGILAERARRAEVSDRVCNNEVGHFTKKNTPGGVAFRSFY